MHKEIKELTGTTRKTKPSIIKDKNGKILIEAAQKLKRWKEYIQELFEDTRSTENKQITAEGPNILKEEVHLAIKTLKSGKAVGPDEIPCELLKLIDDDQLDFLMKYIELE